MSAPEPALEPVPVEADSALDSAEAGGRVIRGGVMRAASYALIVGMSVGSAAALTRHLGVARFGDYTTVLSLVGVVAAVTDAGMSSVGVREYAVRSGRERALWMRELLGLRIALTSLGVVLIVAFGLAAGYDVALLLGAILAGIATLALVVQHTLTIPIAAALRLGTISTLELLRQALTVGALVALALAGAGVAPLLAVTLLINTLLILPTAVLARGEISLRPSFEPSRWHELLQATVFFSLAAAVGTIYVYTAQILTSLVANAHQSGLFAVSFRIFISAAGVSGLIVGGALPLLARAARDDSARLAYALERIFEVSLIAGVGAALTTLGGARFIIDLVAGHRYAGAVHVLQIQGMAMIGSFLVAAWGYAVISLRLYRGLLIGNVLAFLVSTLATLTLASAHGAIGAAIATVCGESVLAASMLVTLWRARPELIPRWGVVTKVLGAAAPATALALTLPLPSLARTVVALGVYGAVIVLTGALPAELREQLAPRLAGRRSRPG